MKNAKRIEILKAGVKYRLVKTHPGNGLVGFERGTGLASLVNGELKFAEPNEVESIIIPLDTTRGRVGARLRADAIIASWSFVAPVTTNTSRSLPKEAARANMVSKYLETMTTLRLSAEYS